MAEEYERQQKEMFEKLYKPHFTEYLDQERLEKKIPSYRYLVDELHKMEITTTESQYHHVMSKKNLLISKNAKQLCRDGIPAKYMKDVLLKMFGVKFSPEDYENKKKEVLKGRTIEEVVDSQPTFGPKKLEEILPEHYLNEKGILALKEVIWLLNGVIPRLEYCPGLVGFCSILLLYLPKEETYELVRTIIEADLNPGQLSNIRWHFRYNLQDHLRLYISITNCILEISKEKVVTQFKSFDDYGLNKVKLIHDMVEKFFIDYINFIGIIKFLPFFLLEGVKGIYRYCYGLVALCPFKMLEDEKKKENELTSLNSLLSGGKITAFNQPEEVVLKSFKQVTNKLENWFYFLDNSNEWGLTHRNNNFDTLKIPREMKENTPKIDAYKYIPYFQPNSNILTKLLVPKLWDKLPSDVKFHDGILLFDKISSPNGDLTAVYNICEKLPEDSLILFLVQTTNDEIFGGIMKQNILFYEDGKYRIPPVSYLFTVSPETNVYAPKDKIHNEIACFEPGALRFGFGENGPAISIDSELKVGWTEKETVFGKEISLIKDYSKYGEFDIKNFEVYIMQ